MSTPAFLREAGLGGLASVTGVAFAWMLAPLLGGGLTLKLLLPALAGGQLAVLCLRHRRAGRVSLLAAWSLCGAALLAFDPPLSVWLATQFALAWLARGVLVHRRPLPALADLALGLLALSAAIATLAVTRSLGLALWVFFLLQALHVFVPAARTARAGADERFDAARARAEAALRRLSASHR